MDSQFANRLSQYRSVCHHVLKKNQKKKTFETSPRRYQGISVHNFGNKYNLYGPVGISSDNQTRKHRDSNEMHSAEEFLPPVCQSFPGQLESLDSIYESFRSILLTYHCAIMQSLLLTILNVTQPQRSTALPYVRISSLFKLCRQIKVSPKYNEQSNSCTSKI